MYWRPAPRDIPPAEYLDDALKRRLAYRLWRHDGSLHGDHTTIGTDDRELIAYLEGLADANVDGARVLWDAIRAHGRVEVWVGDPDD
jgi:hypothetical protein